MSDTLWLGTQTWDSWQRPSAFTDVTVALKVGLLAGRRRQSVHRVVMRIVEAERLCPRVLVQAPQFVGINPTNHSWRE